MIMKLLKRIFSNKQNEMKSHKYIKRGGKSWIKL